MKNALMFALSSVLAASASAQLTTVYENDFGGDEGSLPADIVTNLGLEFVGNGDEGGGFYEGTTQNIVVQSYGSRQVEVGVGSFSLSGVTLEAGTEYTFTLTVTEDQQNWSLAQNVRFGLNNAGNRPGTPAALADIAFDVLLNEAVLPQNLDFVAGPFQTISFTYTPASTQVEPPFVMSTAASDINIFLDARIRLWDMAITTGTDTGGGSPAGPADLDGNEVVDVFDLIAFLQAFSAALNP